MAVDPTLIGRIYEAAVLPDRWPDVLDALGAACGAAGGIMFVAGDSNPNWVAGPRVSWIIEEYIANGYMDGNPRGAPMMAEMYPGFRTDADFRSASERASLPVYRDFLIPRGIDAAAGTVFQGTRDDAVALTLEHFASHEQAKAAVPLLDSLRPHLGRAFSLAARLRANADADAIAALALAGLAAAVVARNGQLRAIDERFARRLNGAIDTHAGRVRFANRFVQARLDQALARVSDPGGVRSIAIPGEQGEPPFALHLLPLRLDARDVFDTDGVLLLLAEPGNASIPGADLLRLLFDLTPTEARLTRLLTEGHAAAEAATLLGMREQTARTHLRSVFAKTGVRRQSDLIRLLLGIGMPAVTVSRSGTSCEPG